MVKVAEPVWLGVGAALVVLAVYSVAISGNAHEPAMLYLFAFALGMLGMAAIALAAWLPRWPRGVVAAASGLLGCGIVVALWFYLIYVGSSLNG